MDSDLRSRDPNIILKKFRHRTQTSKLLRKNKLGALAIT
jgi:hypothetical protein